MTEQYKPHESLKYEFTEVNTGTLFMDGAGFDLRKGAKDLIPLATLARDIAVNHAPEVPVQPANLFEQSPDTPHGQIRRYSEIIDQFRRAKANGTEPKALESKVTPPDFAQDKFTQAA